MKKEDYLRLSPAYILACYVNGSISEKLLLSVCKEKYWKFIKYKDGGAGIEDWKFIKYKDGGAGIEVKKTYKAIKK